MNDLVKSSPLSVARLYDEAGNLSANMRRDLPQFTQYGVTEKEITAMEDAALSLIKQDTDQRWVGWGMNATNKTTTQRNSLLLVLNEVSTKLTAYFGKDDAHHARRLLKGCVSLSNASLAANTATLIDLLTEHPTDFEPALIDSTLVKKLQSAFDAYTSSLSAKKELNANRKAATVTRSNSKTTLYTTILKYSELGRGIWKGIDQSKMEDYMYVLWHPQSPPVATQPAATPVETAQPATQQQVSPVQSTEVSPNKAAA